MDPLKKLYVALKSIRVNALARALDAAEGARRDGNLYGYVLFMLMASTKQIELGRLKEMGPLGSVDVVTDLAALAH